MAAIAPMPAGLSARAQRAMVVAACCGAAVVVLGSGLDRAAASSPAMAKWVMPVFAAASLEANATRMIEAKRFGDAARLAEAAVRAAPIEPDSTALLGSARLAQGDTQGAERAFLVAGQFGWRKPITQYYWMQRALQVNDYRVAALRLDALLRQQPGLVDDAGLMDPLLSTPGGKAALAQRLRERPSWLLPFAQSAFMLNPEQLERRADVIDYLAQSGLKLGCDQIGQITTVLVTSGRPARARATWDAQCGSSGQLITDPDFTELRSSAARSPFDWAIVGDSDVSVSTATSSEGRPRLQIANSAPFPRKVLMQLSILAPGNYRLSWAAEASTPGAPAQIMPSIACQPDAREVLPATPLGKARYQVTFPVDASCPARWIGFVVPAGKSPVLLGDVALVPAG